MGEKATVFVVDDDPGALRSTRWLLESEGLPVETYSSAREFLAAYDPDRPGCLILDLKMPEMHGLELQEKLPSRGAHLPIIFISGHGDVPNCAEAMKGGAIDFLEKPVDDKRILTLVRQAVERDHKRRRTIANHSEIAARSERLTPRERDIVRHLHQGYSIKKIAAHFGISFQTVAKHRTRVLGKLGVTNEAELVRLLADYQFDE